ncbi:MAG: hypothetical protein PHP53_21560 [Prolixibacteraceae bacterium]|nr:hypothetical protein [Prolixibacteraceae bacterium]
MNKTLIPTQNIAVEFALATERKDLHHLESLLSENGTFDIQKADLETQEVGKHEFIKWYEMKLQETEITSIAYDRCLHCFIGNRVVLFNDGQFPRSIKDCSERSKTGIMLDIQDGLISTLKFCYLFAEADNPYVIECQIAKIKEYKSLGMPFKEAYKNVIGEYPPDI